ncbi:MAG TPA: cytochrome-c oxidase [Gammaproteobacteria bacterium]|nr:cytochrome-c oxidase [Gammaproteobacteria bacterium]
MTIDIEARGTRLARLWILIAACYLLVGVAFGIGMAASHKLEFAPVHAHINLLGWATMALTGLIYSRFPRAGGSRLGVLHYWSFQILFPILIAGLIFMFSGHPEMEPVMVVGSIGILASLLLFVVNLFQNTKPAQ